MNDNTHAATSSTTAATWITEPAPAEDELAAFRTFAAEHTTPAVKARYERLAEQERHQSAEQQRRAEEARAAEQERQAELLAADRWTDAALGLHHLPDTLGIELSRAYWEHLRNTVVEFLLALPADWREDEHLEWPALPSPAVWANEDALAPFLLPVYESLAAAEPNAAVWVRHAIALWSTNYVDWFSEDPATWEEEARRRAAPAKAKPAGDHATRVLDHLRAHPEPASRTAIAKAVSGKRQGVLAAIGALIESGQLIEVDGKGTSKLVQLA